jgi:xanthine dehydrogenase small subunit
MTSCLMPLANAEGKHIVTVEGINPENGDLTPVQKALIDESGTQCGFCTVGFVMSLTGFCVSSPHVSEGSTDAAVSAMDGNICRCTGYKSIERAAAKIAKLAANESVSGSALMTSVVPEYFGDIFKRLEQLANDAKPPKSTPHTAFIAGGTDVYVQKPDSMPEMPAAHLFYDEDLRGIHDTGEFIEIGASTTVTDLLESPIMQAIFPNLYKHLKLVSSTPIRNMATLAGNFINASPIGDMTVWFLALDATIVLSFGVSSPTVMEGSVDAAFGVSSPTVREGSVDAASTREIALKDLYLGYKQLAKSDDDYIRTIRFRKPSGDFRFNFEKVCKRTYLDIATVNTAILLRVSHPAPDQDPPIPMFLESEVQNRKFKIEEADIAAGGVAPIPLYLKETSAFLTGKEVNSETIANANEIMQSEISPISDVRGTAEYKRLLLRQLFRAHFHELFGI